MNIEKIKESAIDLKKDGHVFLINSVAEGYANSKSDIDLLVVQFENKAENEAWKQLNFNGIRADVCFIGKELLEKRIDSIFSAKLNDDLIKFGHKIKTAIPLYGDSLTEIIDWVDFDKRVSEFYIWNIANHLEDIDGLCAEEDYDSAILTASSLLDDAFSGYMASLGGTQTRAKWKLKQARKFIKNVNVLNQYTTEALREISYENKKWQLDKLIDKARYFWRLTYLPELGENFPDNKRMYVISKKASISFISGTLYLNNPAPFASVNKDFSLILHALELVDDAMCMHEYLAEKNINISEEKANKHTKFIFERKLVSKKYEIQA
ncbi:hypothetical protein [Paludibacterium purpuratum]|uniref:Uncharacterized protein n=1 Tax=Paludibacterium purpuratum TaxID=1144873 RepID=A0A4R7B605_9NEIS|nr:hypothetical protein [Paludibacterium purpuratum]TDR80061.1 hypothetical protein DFP86_106204 [Paludibacterium purpuratum]